MRNNYEELCRRVTAVSTRIEDAVTSGRLSKEAAGALLNNYRLELLRFQEVYLSPDDESELHTELRAPYVESSTVLDGENTFTLDYVTGLLGIGPECHIPNDFLTQVTEKPD